MQNLKIGAKICAITWTVLYALVLPPLSYYAFVAAALYGSEHFSIPKGLFDLFIMLSLPFSLPISIDLMWSSYVCGKYGKTLLFWLIPWLNLAVVMAWLHITYIQETL